MKHFATVPFVVLSLVSAAVAQKVPSPREVAEMLDRQPITAATWPAWRVRLLEWMEDRSSATDEAFLAARAFQREAAGPSGELTGPLATDSIAWYCLGGSYMNEMRPDADLPVTAAKAETAFRRSIALDPKFARAHRNLAAALLVQPPPKPDEAAKELEIAKQLDPKLPLKHVQAVAAMLLNRIQDAERFALEAVAEDPTSVHSAQQAASAIVQNRNRGSYASAIRPLSERFPQDGILVSLYAVGLAIDGEPRLASQELDRAQSLGVDPATILPPQLISAIREAGVPPWYERLGWVMAYFAGFYAIVMIGMTVAGMMLAGRTRGDRAIDLLGSADEELVSGGQVRRVGRETGLAKLYVAGLFIGLALFYISIPFILAGLIGATVGMLLMMFSARRVPIKLVAIVLVFGLGAVWAVLRSLFAKPASGSFGILKTADEQPDLYRTAAEVAHQVDTESVDQIYLAPGSSIGVHQEGRGPFGVFGVKKRVLTLGLSTMHYLSISELKAILAHEYAHFSHADTFVNRFVYQVSLTIGETLNGMGAAGGVLNYVNPFYWFLVLYHKSYSVLSSGYSRSREFLADRMAAALYGPKVFESALTKVCTDGSLFEMTIYDNIRRLLAENKSFINMYEAFHEYREQQIPPDERRKMYDGLLDEKASLFASHPTFGERVAALRGLPAGPAPDDTPARSLFANAEEVEKELTEFLTGFMHHIQMLEAQAAQG